ncbi:hypothetical protein Tco_0696850 [Tanacetum coccineum]
MLDLKFADTYNLVVFLSKPAKSEGFEQIVDFMNANPIRYALTINPTIYISHKKLSVYWSKQNCQWGIHVASLRMEKKIIITDQTMKSSSTRNAYGVYYEAVYKELGDNLVRAALTVVSLKAGADSGARTMGISIAQNRFEMYLNISKDPLLARGNTLECRMNPNREDRNSIEAMKTCKSSNKGKENIEPRAFEEERSISFDETRIYRLQADFNEEERLQREKDEPI